MSGGDWTLNGPSDPRQAAAELKRLEELDQLKRLVQAHPEYAFKLVMEAIASGRLVLRTVPPGGH